MKKALILSLAAAAFPVALAPRPVFAQQQSPNMNFFVALKGRAPTGKEHGLAVADGNCQDLAYVQGYGNLTWHAYLDGRPEDGEGNVKARDRIGKGPWYNFYGVEIAKNLDELHSDDNNLWDQTALTVTGQMLPKGALEIPWGSELDGKDFSLEGPYFCFGIPQ
jgi:hypothetical protein